LSYDVRWAVITYATGGIASGQAFIVGVRRRGAMFPFLPVTSTPCGKNESSRNKHKIQTDLPLLETDGFRRHFIVISGAIFGLLGSSQKQFRTESELYGAFRKPGWVGSDRLMPMIRDTPRLITFYFAPLRSSTSLHLSPDARIRTPAFCHHCTAGADLRKPPPERLRP